MTARKEQPPLLRYLLEFDAGWWVIWRHNLAEASVTAERFEKSYGVTALSVTRSDCICGRQICMPGKALTHGMHEPIRLKAEASWLTPQGRSYTMGCYQWRPLWGSAARSEPDRLREDPPPWPMPESPSG